MWQQGFLVLIFLFGAYLSYLDLKKGDVPLPYLAVLIPLCLGYGYLFQAGFLIAAITLGGIPMILRYAYKLHKKKEALGMADVFIFFAVGALLRADQLPKYFLVVGLLGILMRYLWHKKGLRNISDITWEKNRFPFIPIQFLSLLIVVWRG